MGYFRTVEPKTLEIIAKKRDGGSLTQGEIEYFVQGVVSGEIPEYQIAAWLMAVYIRGMSEGETTHLTVAMANSGRQLDLSSIGQFVVDKHSTGGVGDKTTLVVAPLVAATGIPVAKMSGRALDFTGGTLDKLESFPGLRCKLDPEEFVRNLVNHGIVIAAQTEDLVPADAIMYSIRDVTETVSSIPLIASSVMSKKIATGASAVVLDVKVGSGAFMKDETDATQLASLMSSIGRQVDLPVTAVISDMSQPLGRAVGNSLEVKEALDALSGRGPADFLELCLVVATQMLILAGKVDNEGHARAILMDTLNSGAAKSKLKQLVVAQGGDGRAVDDPSLLPKAPIIRQVFTPREGFLARVDARELGLTAVLLGAGRAKKEDEIDHSVGVLVHRKVGDRVAMGDLLFTIHGRDSASVRRAEERLLSAIGWSDGPVKAPKIVHRVVPALGKESRDSSLER